MCTARVLCSLHLKLRGVCTAFVLCKPLVCLEGQQGEAESHEGKQALRLEATVLIMDTVHPHQHVAVGHARPCFRQLAVLSHNMPKT